LEDADGRHGRSVSRKGHAAGPRCGDQNFAGQYLRGPRSETPI
jgi:hypothetical protein